MDKKWIGTQIVLNNHPDNDIDKDDHLKKKLVMAKEMLDLDALIVWSDNNKKNLDVIRRICSDLKIQTYLWYPVLADTPGIRIEQDQAVKTFDGLRGYGKLGCWDKIGKGEEDFLFLCPNDKENINRIFNHYVNKIEESGVQVETNPSGYTRLQFSPMEANIPKIKKKWDKTVTLLPVKNQPASTRVQTNLQPNQSDAVIVRDKL